jgi:GDP-L-fucose synthase
MNKVWITGHRGMVGGAVYRFLKRTDCNILTSTRSEVDLCNQKQVKNWLIKNKPNLIYHIGAKVGGIVANKNYPADFITDNLLIQTNVISAAKIAGVENIIFVASNCTYPKVTSQPIKEDALLTGAPEENIRPYSISKIAGIEMCRAYNKQYGCNYKSVIPPNLYGIGDNYDPINGHVIAGIIRRAHEAKKCKSDLIVWGDGTARRELLNADDLAEGMVHLANSETYDDLFNVGCGEDYTIKEIAEIVADVVGFSGNIVFDSTKPNGTMRKLLDSSRINKLGWKPKINITEGLNRAYKDYKSRYKF